MPAAEAGLWSPQFRRFYLGRTIAVVGDQISPVALSFAVLSISRSTGALGLVLGAQVLPEAAFVLFGGVLADRWDRRRLMIVTDVVRMCLQAATAALLLSHEASIGSLIALQVGYGLATAFFGPAYNGFVGQFIADEHLQTANSFSTLAYSVASIAGPALGGVLVAAGSPGTALAVDAGTFAVSAVALAGVRTSRIRPDAPVDLIGELRHGWREFTRQTWVWVLVGFWSLYQGSVLASYAVLGPVVSRRSFGGASVWAAVLTARGVGAVVGGLVAIRIRPRRPMVVACLLLLTDVPLLLLLARPGPVAALVAAGVFEGAALSYGGVLWITALQQRVPESAQSRVFAYDQFGSIVLLPVGLVMVGLIAHRAGIAGTLTAVAGAHLVLMAIAVSVPSVRRMVRAPVRPAPDAAPGG